MPSAFQRKARTIPGAEAGASTSAEASSSTTSPASSSSTPSLQIPTHPTLRPSPFPQQQPLPLFSAGLSAINDILTGVGLPSGCLALFQPLQSDESDDDEHERTRLEAGAAYADLVLRYGAAQGIAHGHRVVVIGEGVQAWCRGLMGWAGEGLQDKAQKEAGEQLPETSESEQSTPQDDSSGSRNNLKSAFRYDKLQKIQASQGRDENHSAGAGTAPFVHPFDLTLRMSDVTIDEAFKSGNLIAMDVGDLQEEETYDAIWHFIQDTLKTHAEDATPLRIILPSLGSPLYTTAPTASHSTSSYRLLHRIKTLLRSLSWPSSSTQLTPRPTIALCTLSPTLILHSPSTPTRLSHISDSTVALSSFASDARLRAMFCDSAGTSTSTAFTGSLKIIKTPTVGSLRSSSIRASTLRGMSSSGALDSEGTTENSLGFKVRRKGFKVEVMGRDLVAGGEGNDKEKPKRPVRPSKVDRSVEGEKDQGAVTRTVDVQKTQAPPKDAPAVSVAAPQLKGIAALRARGLQAAARREVGGAVMGADNDASANAQDAAAKRLQGLKLAAKQDW